LSRRAASIVRSIRTERGGSISTEITKRRSARARARPVGGGGSVAEAEGLAFVVMATDSGSIVAGRATAAELVPDCPAVAAIVSRASRIAATCSGVVPQQPPSNDPPAARKRGTIRAR
jgi:hypothetical protein